MSQFVVRESFFNNGCRFCENRYLDPEEEPTPEEEAEKKRKSRRLARSKPLRIHVKNWRQCLSCQTEDPTGPKFGLRFPFQTKILLTKHDDLKAKPCHVKILEAFATVTHNPAKTCEIKTGLSDEGFQRGTRKLVEEGLLLHPRRGYYTLTEKGRLSLNV